MMARKVFISGVAGFLGSQLAHAFIENGDHVIGIDNLQGGDMLNVSPAVDFHPVDCNDLDAVRPLMRGAAVVAHCAAAPYEGLSVFSPALVYEHTTQSTVSLLSAACASRIQRFVLCSSMARYGEQEMPFRESQDPRPVDPYGHAKLAAEKVLQNLCELHGIEWSIAIPHNIYGPNQRYHDPFRNVISIMINRMLLGQQPIIYGDGLQRRCFSYISDVLPPLMQMCNRADLASEVINIGPDHGEVSILELASLISTILNTKLDPIFVPSRPAEVKHANCSADKARRLLGYESRWSLRQGIEKTVEYIMTRGPRPFDYHLPIEIVSAITPSTWTERLI
jgi:UDP-glucose 4-epimerase